MKPRIQKYNEWINANIFYVVLVFVGLFMVTIGSICYGIWLGDTQRTKTLNNGTWEI